MLIFFKEEFAFINIIYLSIENVLLTMMFTQLRAHEPGQILPNDSHCRLADLANVNLHVSLSFSFLSSVNRIGKTFSVFSVDTLMDMSLRCSNFVTSFNVIRNSIFCKFSIT